MQMVKKVKETWQAIQIMITRDNKTDPIVTSFQKYIRLLFDHDLNRIVVKKIDTELSTLVGAIDYSNLAYIQLLLTRLKALWEIKESVSWWG